MKRRSFFSVADHALIHDLNAAAARDCVATAELLDIIAEVDARKLYAPAGYPSMYQYLVSELHMSEDVALKRIDAARAARQFPAIFDAVAEGRLNLSGLMLLLPHFKTETAASVQALLASATHKSNAGIRELLAERFPMPDVPTLLQALPVGVASRPSDAPPVCDQEAQVAVRRPGGPGSLPTSGATPGCVEQVAAHSIELASPRSKVAPLSPQRFKCEFTMRQEMRDKLKHAQDLIGGDAAGRELATVLERALDELIVKLEKQRFAATAHPRPQRRTPKGRHIPAEVKRAVAQRDGGRCTFVSDEGLRCCATSNLEYDHIDPVARGGQSTVNGLRLRCRAHNQYTAERTFGGDFMQEKRQASKHRAAMKREAALKNEAAKARESEAAGDLAAEQSMDRLAWRVGAACSSPKH